MALLGCGSSVSGLEVSRHPDFPTLLEVSAELRGGGPLLVRYGEDGRLDRDLRSEGVGGLQTLSLLGLPESTEVRVQACPVGREDSESACEETTVETGPVPGKVAPFELVSGEAEDGPGFVLTSVITGDEGESSVQILDGLGRPTFALEPEWGFSPTARFDVNGLDLLLLITSKDHVEDAVIRRQPLDGGASADIPAPYAHHDFVQHEDGTLAWIAAELQVVDGEDVVGDQIVERAPDGTERVVWSAFDWLEVERNAGWDLEQYPFGVDWTHGNGLSYDPVEGAYTLSLYYHRAIVKVDGSTGEMLWMLGGESSDFVLEDEAVFGPQHAPGLTEDGRVTVFDNGGSSGSRLLALDLDEGAGTASTAWIFQPDDGRRNLLLGDNNPQPDGSILATWGEHGEVSRVVDGEIVWELDCGQPGVVGQISARESLYP